MTTATRAAPRAPATSGTSRPKLGRVDAQRPAQRRIVVNAVEGWGKTTLGAYAPKPAILMSRGESGYVTLKQSGLAPDADCIELASWQDTLALIDDLIEDPGEHETVVFDALGGFERLCHERVCARDFSNDWGEKGFGSFQKGYDVSVPEWLNLLSRLDRLHATHGLPIIMLSHSKVKSFKNPMGSDFDRYIADCNEKTWGVTHKWADAVLFGTFATVTQEDKKTKRVKGIGGVERVIYTTRRDAFDAKNRYSLPDQIDIPNDPTAVWSTVWDAISGKRSTNDEIPE